MSFLFVYSWYRPLLDGAPRFTPQAPTTMRAMPFYHRAPHDRGPLIPATTLVLQDTEANMLEGEGWREVGYAVVDVETTGLSPTTDSILEIGLVLTNPNGDMEHSWSTLVDPGVLSGVGPTHIHGLHAEDLSGAPSLPAVADLLVRDLAGRVVVAHNARFDLGFLTQALGNLGMLDDGARIPRVCTMEWARRFITTPSRRLVTCCEVSGVEIGQHHNALDDARAATGLLRHYLAVTAERSEPVVWERALREASVFSGWHWDQKEATAGENRLVPRTSPGVLRG